MTRLLLPLLVLGLLAIPTATADAVCGSLRGCVDAGVATLQDGVEELQQHLTCTTEVFGCYPEPAKSTLQCFFYGMSCERSLLQLP